MREGSTSSLARVLSRVEFVPGVWWTLRKICRVWRGAVGWMDDLLDEGKSCGVGLR